MPFLILASTDEINEVLSGSINRIQPKINENILNSTRVLITDLERVISLYGNDEFTIRFTNKSLSNSFGFIHTYGYEREIYHFVIINLNLLNSLELTAEEIDGVISHELGHIFNEPIPYISSSKEIFGRFYQSISSPEEYKREKGIDDERREEYQNNKEFYADFFSKTVGCKEGLLGSIDKYLNMDGATNRELFQKRIEKLNNEESFSGNLKPLHTIPQL